MTEPEVYDACPACGRAGKLEGTLAPGQLYCPTDIADCRVKTFMER